MPDIVAMLTAEHDEVRKLLDQLTSTNPTAPRTREKLREKIKTALQIHTRVEEEIFYPAFRSAGPDDEDEQLYLEAVEEHRLADDVLAKLEADDVPENTFAAHAKLLKDLIEHHAEEEEKEMFPRARKVLDKAERMRLGEQMSALKKASTA
jgi:hemerythrin superfamily protein